MRHVIITISSVITTTSLPPTEGLGSARCHQALSVWILSMTFTNGKGEAEGQSKLPKVTQLVSDAAFSGLQGHHHSAALNIPSPGWAMKKA